jgi:hypothetical protein
MKLDKETLLKHKFWLLLLVTVPLTLGAIFLLVTSVSGEISAKRKKVVSDLAAFQKVGDIKTPEEIAIAKRDADIEKGKEKIVWEKAYEKQEDLFTWPQKVEDEFNFKSGLFAQKISVYRGKEPPADTTKNDRRLVGKVLDQKGGYIEVLASDNKKHQIFRSMRWNLDKIPVEGDETTKEISFSDIRVGDGVSVWFHRGKYFNEPLTDDELNAYKAAGVYLSQIEGILTQVQPMNPKGEGVVQLKGWWYEPGKLPPSRTNGDQRFLYYLDPGWVDAQGDFSEEAWLAQEDLWIQRELFRLIRMANDEVSKFEGVTAADQKGGEDKNKVYTFRNPYWEMGLNLQSPSKLVVTLKNLLSRKQKLEVKFRVRLNKTMAPEIISISGDPLGPQKEWKKDYLFKDDNPSRKGIYGVEQVLTWETAAVKRVDLVSVGSLSSDEYSHGHRTFADDQKALTARVELKPGEALPALPTNAQKKPSFGGRGSARSKRVDTTALDQTRHGLIRNRYVEFSDQSRRVPVSLALIVDQDHIDRVETAFNNSKLRFLTTQVLLNQYTSSVRPQLPPVDGQGVVGPPRVAPPTYGAQGDSRGGTGGGLELENNYEMVLYGIVTLYERYPPKLAASDLK